MTFRVKIDKILRLNKLGINSPSGLEQFINAGTGAIAKYYRKNEEPGEGTIKKILELPGLNKTWWETGQEPVFMAEVNGNHTHGENEPAIEEKDGRHAPEEIYRDLVEANSEYRLVPKTILEGKYVIVLESQVGKTEEALWVALRAKDDYISDLKREIAEYRSSRTPAQKRK